jgi:hypothetical protein
MKKLIYILTLLVIVTGLVSCQVKEERIKKEDKEFVVLDGDTLGIVYEKHTVISCERTTPNNIHEEMNPSFNIKLEDGTSFRSRKTYEIGDSIIYTIYTK